MACFFAVTFTSYLEIVESRNVSWRQNFSFSGLLREINPFDYLKRQRLACTSL